MADRALRFDLLGRDRTLSRTLGQAEGRFKRFGGAAIKMGAVISGAFAGIAVAGFLKGAIDEAREAQKVGRQTAAVLKATGGVAKVSARDIDRLSTALSNQAGVDDELIASGANLLLTFKGVRNEAGKGNRIFDRASVAILDMTAAMNDGEVSTSGLRRSTIQVGKALNDPIKGMTALTRVGVTFTEAQKDQVTALVESGRKMDAQRIILAELSSEFGGAAKAAADPWQRLGVVWANLKESFGTTLLPIVNVTVEWLGRSLPGAFAAFQRVLAPVVGFLQQRLPGALRTAQGAVRTLADAFRHPGVTAGGFTGVLQQIGSATRGLYDTGQEAAGRLIAGVQSKFNQWRPSLVTFRDNLVAGIKRFGQPIISGLTTGVESGDWEPLGRALGDALVAALRGAADLGAKVGAWARQQFGQIDWYGLGKDVGRQAVPFAVGFSATLLDGLLTSAREHPLDTVAFFLSFLGVGKMGGVIAKLLERVPFLRAFAPMFRALHGLTAPLNNTIGRILRAMGGAFSRGLGLESVNMGRAIARRFDGLRLRIWAFGERFAGAGLHLIERLGRGVLAGGRFVVRANQAIDRILGRFLGVLFNPISSRFGQAGGSIISHLADGMRRLGGAVSRAASAIISRVVSPFRSAGGWLIGEGRAVVSGLVSGIRGAIGSVGGVLRSLKDAIVGGVKRLFGIHSPSTVMAGLGGNIVAGLVRGLIGNASSLRAVIKSIGANMVDWFGSSIGGLLGGFAGGNIRFTGGPVVDLARNMAAQMGWVGGQWNALYQLVAHESGWNPAAQNPTSTAYGLFQFLNSSWAGTGFAKTSDPARQIAAGLNYIRQRYGDPASAWSFWQAHHWYGSGLEPTVFSRPTLIGVGERGPETVSVTPQGRALPNEPLIDYDRLATAVVRALHREPLVAVVSASAFQAGMNAHAGRMGQARPYR